MPLFTYSCPCGNQIEHLHRSSDTHSGEPVSHLHCHECDNPAVPRDTASTGRYTPTTVGVVSDGIEEMNRILLSPAQRRAGMELKTASDIHRHEESLGIHREVSYQTRVHSQESVHDGQVISKIREEKGVDAAVDHVDTTEIMHATGWDEPTTKRWKETANAAEAAVADGTVDLATHKTIGTGGSDLAVRP